MIRLKHDNLHILLEVLDGIRWTSKRETPVRRPVAVEHALSPSSTKDHISIIMILEILTVDQDTQRMSGDNKIVLKIDS